MHLVSQLTHFFKGCACWLTLEGSYVINGVHLSHQGCSCCNQEGRTVEEKQFWVFFVSKQMIKKSQPVIFWENICE